jgi:hypothetical protein
VPHGADLRVSGIVSFAPSQRKRVLLDLITTGLSGANSLRRNRSAAGSRMTPAMNQSDALCADLACEGQV